VIAGRRAFIAATAALAAAAPARAQQPRPLVAFIGAATRQERFERALATGLRDQGFVPGRHIDIEFHWTAGTLAPVRGIVARLLERRVAVIVTGGGNVARAVRELTGTIPIVFATSPDPVASSLVASLSRPGGSVTGLSLQSVELTAKWVEVLRDLLPRIARIAVIYSSLSPFTAGQRAEIIATSRSIGVAVAEYGVAAVEALDGAFASAVAGGADGAIILRDFLLESNRERIVALAARHRLPTVYEQSEFVRAGGLVSYGAELVDLHRRAAGYVARILRGASPADLPVEQPVRFEFMINLATARALGLTPSSTMLTYADEVIE